MPAPQPPRGLKAWGKALWEQVTDATPLDPAGYYILAEACRTADIIERLSGMLNSNSTQWVALADEAVQFAMVEGENIASINLTVNPVMSEIRQQRLAMRQLLAQLKLGKVMSDTADDDDPIARMMAEFSTPD